MTNRRRFIRNCSAVAVSGTLLPAFVISRREVSLSELHFETFAALVNSQFISRNANGASQSLELVEVTGRAASFFLLFRGDPARPLLQETYAFEHARVGRFEMFIVPVGHLDCGYCYYEAVFNRQPHEGLYG